ncbi:MAG: AmmeMemoRadiSam system protein B [Candidatus Aminicenantales bacterium]
MSQKKSVCLLVFFLAVSFSWAQGTRKPVWAGKFYEQNPERLSSQIDAFLQAEKTNPIPPNKIFALIVPHAGYVYSGPVAASAYSLVLGKDFETVVIIGPSHYFGFDGCSIYPKGGFETPLGVAKIDESLASDISNASGFSFIPQAHEEEHSLEVQVPFIQKVLPRAKIVPIVMGFPSEHTVRRLANALAGVLPQKKILVVASTDMSHFLSRESANHLDRNTISLIQSLSINTLLRKVERGENILCGGGAVAAALLYAQKIGTPRVEVLSYADSSKRGGPETKVVGYLAAAICAGPSATQWSLSQEEKKELLHLARQAIIQYIKEKTVLAYEINSPNFLAEKGVFVTLTEQGNLRGCIGFLSPAFPLYQAVIQAAIYASSRDPRFPPLTLDELKTLEIEISILTPLLKIDNPRLIQVGRHGLMISMGDQNGVLLPQVAVENHWSRETFLRHACLKAGLKGDAWKKGAEIYIFEALVFH